MNWNNKEDVKLIVDGCIRGDKKSQHLLYKNSYGKMLGVCMRYASNRDEAKDLLHDGYIKVFDKISSYNFSGSFEGWLRKLFVNNNLDYLKKKKIVNIDSDKVNCFLENVSDDSDELLENISQNNISAEKLIALIQELSPAYRTIFNLYYIEDYTHKEIASMLNISEGTSKSNLSRAKLNLKNLYIEKYGFKDE
jgi:RNA polymerase sigma-70 factor (ECF subfamily)